MTTPTDIFTPYSTVAPLLTNRPSWMSAMDSLRIASYQKYEEIYWNMPQTFKLVQRGTDSQPIYIPNARIIIDTMHRYVGPKMDFMVDPSFGGDQAALAQAAFRALFARERIRSKYNSAKRFGLIRGDWMFHVIGDGDKPQGRRISVLDVDPASYFPVHADGDVTNPDSITHIHLAEQYTDKNNKAWVRRLTYSKVVEDGRPRILRSQGIFDPQKWLDMRQSPERPEVDPALLPPGITAIPVYHIKNFEEPRNPFGSSEIRGLEALMAAVNQTISDEDLALALDGIGVYATSSGAPVDEDGNETDWVLGPGRVVENVQDFNRVNGVGSVSPYQNHIEMIVNFLREAAGTTADAIGNIDVQVAESGVARLLRLAPILAKAEEKDQVIEDVLTQMFFDLKTWHTVYEQQDITASDVVPVFGDKLPANRKEEVELAVQMMSTTPPIWSAGTARAHLLKFGYVFEKDEGNLVAQEQEAHTEVTTPPDAFAERAAAELAAAAGVTDGSAEA